MGVPQSGYTYGYTGPEDTEGKPLRSRRVSFQPSRAWLKWITSQLEREKHQPCDTLSNTASKIGGAAFAKVFKKRKAAEEFADSISDSFIDVYAESIVEETDDFTVYSRHERYQKVDGKWAVKDES